MGLDLAQLRNLVACQALQRARLCFATRDTRQAVDREITRQVLAQHREVEVQAGEFVDQEKRRL